MVKAWNVVRGMVVAWALVWLPAACGSSAPSCEQAIRSAVAHVGGDETFDDGDVAELVSVCIRDKWSAEMRSCVATARTPEKLDACASSGGGPSGRRSEAELNLDMIRKSAKTYFATSGEFPRGSVGLTPAEPCCGPGGRSKCRVSTSDWNGVPVWDALDFEVIEDHYYQYSYQSDGKTFEARAVGNLDCDDVSITFILRGKIEDGAVTTELIKPEHGD